MKNEAAAIAHSPDLTKRAPRSPRVRLGGYVILPRMLDKGRAAIIKKNGEYNFDCTLDNYFLSFVGVKAADIYKLLEEGKGDAEVLAWVNEHAEFKHRPEEIIAWSEYHEKRSPADVEGREFFNSLHQKCAVHRNDIFGWFDLLDLDDYISFGGKA